MNIKIAYSGKNDATDAVADLKQQLSGVDSKMIIYFASSALDPNSLSDGMQRAFDGSTVFGCSTAGEIISGKMLKDSVVAMALDSTVAETVKIEVVEKVSADPDVSGAMASFGQYFGQDLHDMDVRKYVGIVLIDGLSGAEEQIMDQIGDLTNLTFIGGSAGDDLKFRKTFIYANGKGYTDAALLALVKTTSGFDIIKTQSFRELDKKLTVTKVNEARREVLEFNDQPAPKAYAEAVNASLENASSRFMTNPIGLMVDDEPYVRSPQQIAGNSMIFYCNVLEGMELSLLESTDIIKDTTAALEAKKKELGKISGVINFHCILRTLELQEKGLTDAYGKIFLDVPTIGFSTYGEEYIGHINQTSTMLVFK